MTNLLNKKIFLFTCLFFTVLLIVPSVASAANVMGNLMDPIQVALDGISVVVGPWGTVILLSFIFFIFAGIVLIITTDLLQGAIENSIETLNILQGEGAIVVHAGWNFMAGIVNMMLLIGFVAIAIAIIMGSESYGLKKAMPKLIIVAFLVNFTLLFVGIGVDITNIIYNTIASRFSEDGGNMLIEATKPILVDLWPAGVAIFTGFIISWVTIAIFPPTALGAHALFAFSFPVIIPFILQFVIVGVIMLLMSGVFFTFYAVFIARTLIISVLAILSPLAFFCLIFPATKQYWDKWLKHFISWLFVGVAFIFFMYIGLALAPLAMRLGEDSVTLHPFLKWWTGNLVSYIILLIYFVIILGIVKKFIPELASAAIAQAKSAASIVAPYAQFAGGTVLRGYQQQYSRGIAERINTDSDFAARRDKIINNPPGVNAGWWEKTQYAWKKRAMIDAPKKYGAERINSLQKTFDNKDETDHNSIINNKEVEKNPEKVFAAMLSAHKKNYKIEERLQSLSDKNKNSLMSRALLLGQEKAMQKSAPVHHLLQKTAGTERDKAREKLIATIPKDDLNRIVRAISEIQKDPSVSVAEKTESNLLLKQILLSSRENQREAIKEGGKETFDHAKQLHTSGTITTEQLHRFFGSIIGHPGQWLLDDGDYAAGKAANKS